MTTTAQLEWILAPRLGQRRRVHRGPRRGKIRLEPELERLGVLAKHSTPNHSQTCGKVERFRQTLKRYLARHSGPTRTGVSTRSPTRGCSCRA